MLKRGVIWSLLLLLLPVVALAAVPTYKVKYAASPVTGGSVSAPDSRNPYPTSSAVGARFRAMANFGQKVLLVSLANPADGVITYDPSYATNGYFTVVPTKDTNLTVTFGVAPSAVYANPGPSLNLVGLGATKTITLAGTGSSVPTIAGLVFTYSWTIADPNGHLVNPTSATPGFYADVPGSYAPILVVTAAGKTSAPAQTIVNVTTNTNLDSITCIACHNARSPQIVLDYKSSIHNTSSKPTAPSCQSCHTVVNAAASHPANLTPFTTMGNVCLNCHNDGSGNVPLHPIAIGVKQCIYCHNPHSTVATDPDIPAAVHFNNVTGGAYPASYMTSRATCYNCHIDTAANATVRGQWAQSGHANVKSPAWTTYDFKTRAGCVQCHTTTGFIAYSTGKVTAAWGLASDKTKEMVTCVACHKDVPTGTLRTVAPIKPYADDTYVNRNVGSSNLCVSCHGGRNNGSSVKSANFTNQAFVSPHYMAAAGLLHGQGAYNFSGYAYYSSNSHRKIGMGNSMGTGTAGPCVECHMSASSKHLYRAVSTDAGGIITSIDTTLCANCHNSSLTVDSLKGNQADFDNGLVVLNAALAYKGFVYSATYPYFVNTNWGSGTAGANSMGAAFNYVLLTHEPAAYAHNPAYAKQLVVDSIDAAYHDGTLVGSIDDALSTLVGAGKISQAQADSLTAYKGSNNCATCHTNTTGSHTKHLNSKIGADSIGCVNCHNATAASNTALIPGTTKHLNGVKDVIFSGTGSYAAGSCSTVYCHSNGAATYSAPVWGGSALNCGSCHPLASLRGAHAAHIGSLIPAYGDTANSSTAAEYRFGCGSCHPTDISSHLNGTIDVTLVATADGSLRSKNDPTAIIGGIGNSGSGITGTSGATVSCAASYCHSNGGVGAALAYVASPNWYGTYTGDRCAMCHANAPATGAHAKHGVSIHSGLVSDIDGNLIPAAAAPGTVAGHGDTAQATTIGCGTCHSATVTNSANDKGAACSSCHTAIAKGTPTLDKTVHLNGSVNVSFKDVKIITKAQIAPASFGTYSAYWTRSGSSYKVGTGSFDTARSSLNQATFGGDKSCANVVCHNGGTPKWSDKLHCVNCHSAL